jgi:hypothetical protein
MPKHSGTAFRPFRSSRAGAGSGTGTGTGAGSGSGSDACVVAGSSDDIIAQIMETMTVPFAEHILSQAPIPSEELLHNLLILHDQRVHKVLRDAFRNKYFPPEARKLFFRAMQLIRSIPPGTFLISVRGPKELHETRDYLQTLVMAVCLCLQNGLMTEAMRECIVKDNIACLGNKFHSREFTADIFHVLGLFGCKLIVAPRDHVLDDKIADYVVAEQPTKGIGSGVRDMRCVFIMA